MCRFVCVECACAGSQASVLMPGHVTEGYTQCTTQTLSKFTHCLTYNLKHTHAHTQQQAHTPKTCSLLS